MEYGVYFNGLGYIVCNEKLLDTTG